MYKIVSVALFILCVAFAANAQESQSKKIISKFELVAGPSFSRNTGYLSDYDSKAGYSFGLGYHQTLSKFFSVNLRSLYEAKGSAAQYSYTLLDGNGITDIDEKYTA